MLEAGEFSNTASPRFDKTSETEYETEPKEWGS